MVGDQNQMGVHRAQVCDARGKRGRGQGLVEFAIILPLLVLVIVGVFDVGRAFHALITVTNAAREGARYGILYAPNDLEGIRNAVQREAQNSGITLVRDQITRDCPGGTCESGEAVTVTVTFDFEPILGFFGGDLTITRSIEMYLP
jgi:Flp pilus assembly protein TadG